MEEIEGKRRHGGARPGAGHPRGQGPYREPTAPIRGPLSLVDDFKAVLEAYRVKLASPLPASEGIYSPALAYGERVGLAMLARRVPAGFPSPADDHLEEQLDIHQYLVEHPAATFLMRVSGDSMEGAGIHEGDILVVDRSVKPTNGRIVVAAVDGDLTVKRLRLRAGGGELVAEHPGYAPIPLGEEVDLLIWGVVTGVVRRL